MPSRLHKYWDADHLDLNLDLDLDQDQDLDLDLYSTRPTGQACGASA